MNSAKGHRELVAHLQSHRPRLSETQVVGVSGTSSTDQTGLRGNELEVDFVAEPTGLSNRKYALVDLAGRVVMNVCRSRRELVIGRLRDGRGYAGLLDCGFGFAGAALSAPRLSGTR